MVTTIFSPNLLTVLTAIVSTILLTLVCLSISSTLLVYTEGGVISIPKMMSLISDWVNAETLTLFFLPKSARIRFFNSTST